jgi:preprotein translocase subunit SecF
MNKKEDFGKFDFVSKIGLFGGISVLLTVVSIVFLATHGITYGIDFAGGTELQVKFQNEVKQEEIRKMADDLKLLNPQIQKFEGSEYVIRFQTETGKAERETNDLQNARDFGNSVC